MKKKIISGNIKYFHPIVKCTDCVFGAYLKPMCFYGIEYGEIYAIECTNTECVSFGNKMEVDYCEIPCGSFIKQELIYEI
jgi:hypothetical protein